MTETLSEQLDEYRANWRTRVPADRQDLMDQHVAHLTATGIDRSAKQVGDRAPAIRLRDQHGEMFDVAALLAKLNFAPFFMQLFELASFRPKS